ncbi:MAG: outer membrane protein assembly factor BamA [Candidatus Krumholzibacteriia bacterium]
MKKRRLQIIGCALLLQFAALQASAQKPIAELRIEGNVAVSEQKIRRIVRLKEGDPFVPSEVSQAVKRLYATREFADIRAYEEDRGNGVVVTLVVTEHLKIDTVKFEGNKHVKEEELRKAIRVREGGFIRPSLIRQDFRAIEEIYREKGYYRAAVSDEVVSAQDEKSKKRTRVLVYRVAEGEKVSVKHVDFFGNRSLDSEDLRGAMDTKEDNWIRGAEFKPKVLDSDLEKIVLLYREHGYLDAQVTNKELIFSEDGKGLDVFVTLDEGTRYVVGNVAWSGNTIFKDPRIASLITFDEGDVFDDREFTDIQVAISTLYWDRGYIYNSVSPRKTVKKNVIDLDFDITEGNPAHIHEISISGNTKTAETVIRRELKFIPGEVFQRPKLMRSLREVFNLGFFEAPPEPEVTTANEDGDININLKVAEKQTGQFRLGAGFSALNSISGFIGLAETNFLGRGQRVGIDWEFSRFRQNVDLRFTEPWLFGTPTTLSINAFRRDQDQVRQQFWDDQRRGGSLSIGRPFPWFDYTTVFWRYRWESITLDDFSPAYTGPLRDILWPQVTSSTAITFTRNSTDSPFRPTSGTRASFTAEANGGPALGGDVEFQRYEASFAWYEKLFWNLSLAIQYQTGVLDGYSSPSQVPDYELYRLGGNRRNAVRGYDFFEIVPENNPEFLGGRYMQTLSYEITLPIAPTVFAVGFFDAGNTWNSFRGSSIFDLKKGLGLGIRLELPALGTVGFDYGYGFDKIGGAGWEPHISLGAGF